MHGAKVEVALGGDVGDVDGDSALLAERVDLGGGCGVVDGGEDHGDCGVVEVGGVEGAVDVGDEVLGDAVGDFGDEAGGGGDDGDEGVGVEEVEDPPGGDLGGVSGGVRGGTVEGSGGGGVYVSAADHNDPAAADLPGEEKGAPGLDRGEFFGACHWVCRAAKPE